MSLLTHVCSSSTASARCVAGCAPKSRTRKLVSAMASRAAFAIRREVIEYGALPIASWLGDIDSTAAVLSLLKQLTEALRKSGSDPSTSLTCPVAAHGLHGQV